MNKTINKFLTGIALVAVLTCGYAIGSHDQGIRDKNTSDYASGATQGRKAAQAYSNNSDALPFIGRGHSNAFRQGYHRGFSDEANSITRHAAKKYLCDEELAIQNRPFIYQGQYFAYLYASPLSGSAYRMSCDEADAALSDTASGSVLREITQSLVKVAFEQAAKKEK